MRTASVEIALTDAWEVWTVRVPDDVPEDETAAWVQANFQNGDEKVDDEQLVEGPTIS